MSRDRETAFLLLGLAPAAAACARVADALWLSAAVVVVLVVTTAVLQVVRAGAGAATGAGSGPAAAPSAWGTLLVAGCAASLVQAGLIAALPATAARLGVALPLLAATVPAMGRAIEDRRTLPTALAAAIARGAVFTAVLVVVTVVREVLGAGTITLASAIPVHPFFDDPARALGLSGGALLCLGYAAAIARGMPRRRSDGQGGAS